MTQLLLLRHGKSDWHAGVADHERPLNDRGRRAAEAVGRFLRSEQLTPDLVLSSSAVRARTTAEVALAAGGWAAPLEVHDDLYLPSVEDVLGVVADRGSGSRLLVIGHEPTWSGLVGHLTSAVVRYPTAALAVVDVHVRLWSEVDLASRGELVAFVPPRLLTDGADELG